MVEKIQFKIDKVKEAEDFYSKLTVSSEQNKLVSDLANEISQHISISDRAIKGFFWRSAREYQITHHKKIEDVGEISPAERAEGFGEIIKLVKNVLTRSLVDQAHEELLDKALNKALSKYKEKYANR